MSAGIKSELAAVAGVTTDSTCFCLICFGLLKVGDGKSLLLSSSGIWLTLSSCGIGIPSSLDSSLYSAEFYLTIIWRWFLPKNKGRRRCSGCDVTLAAERDLVVFIGIKETLK